MPFLRLPLHWQILAGMLLGTLTGFALTIWASDQTTTSSPGDTPTWTIVTTGTEIRVNLERDARATNYIVDSTYVPGTYPDDTQVDEQGQTVHYFPSVQALQKGDPQAYALVQQYGRSWARRIGEWSAALGDLFLRMLKMISIPLIVCALLTGITGLGRTETLGRMFGRTVLFYAFTTTMAVLTGLTLVNLIRPGHARGAPEETGAAAATDELAAGSESLGALLWKQVELLIPTNPIAAFASGDFLSIIAFTLAVGIFAVLAGGRALEALRNFAEVGFEIMMRMTMAIVRLAPLGVMFMMLATVSSQGLSVFGPLGWYMLTVASGLAIHGCITLPLIIRFVAKRNPLEFATAVSPALLTAFSSASSNAALPLTLASVEQRAGISNRVTSFVLPLGATLNMDGTALYEVVAVLFIAQWTPGIELSVAQQVLVVFLALLASMGGAGVPHAGLILMIIILQAVGLPTEKQAIIIGVDRVLDMCRTTINVWSDTVACAVVSRFEALLPGPTGGSEAASSVAGEPAVTKEPL